MEAILQRLQKYQIEWIRIVYVDNANHIRSKAFHIDRIHAYAQRGIGLSPAGHAFPITHDVVLHDSGLTPVGENWLKPIWKTLRILPFAPRHASVMGYIESEGKPWSLCGRNFLKRMIELLAKKGLSLKAAFEFEFYLLHQESFDPIDHFSFASNEPLSMASEFINHLGKDLRLQGIVPECCHSEGGPGQYEMSIHFDEAMTAADHQVIFRETVHNTARAHDLVASFLPKTFENQAGVGCHLHFSLWKDQQNVTAAKSKSKKVSVQMQHFMAGILHHLPALMAITTPTENSFNRLKPFTWAGAFSAWGIDNREVALRVPLQPENNLPTNVEFKIIDACANPYLALGAIIAAGLDGIKEKKTLSEPLNVDPSILSAADRSKCGVTTLPTNLSAALKSLRENDMLCQALGEQLLKAYLLLKEEEMKALKTLKFSAQVKALMHKY